MYTGISTESGTVTKKLQFAEDRLINKSRMSQAVLDILRRNLDGLEVLNIPTASFSLSVNSALPIQWAIGEF